MNVLRQEMRYAFRMLRKYDAFSPFSVTPGFATTLAVCLIAARRAAKVDPMAALRCI